MFNSYFAITDQSWINTKKDDDALKCRRFTYNKYQKKNRRLWESAKTIVYINERWFYAVTLRRFNKSIMSLGIGQIADKTHQTSHFHKIQGIAASTFCLSIMILKKEDCHLRLD